MTAPTRPEMSVSEPTLFVAFELGKREWKLAMTSGFGVHPWLRTVASGDLGAVQRALTAGQQRLGVPPQSPVVSCYEAGRDGFWIHRALTQLGVRNRVVDSASIEVNRRARRAKTDRLDALKLVRMLVRVCCGERGVWSEVRVPTVAQEAARHVSRERTTLTQDQTRLMNQLRGWLATWGSALPAHRRDGWWTRVRDGAGAALPVEVQARLARATARLAGLAAQIAELETQQQAAVTTAAPTSALRQLVQLKGVATTSASGLLDEGLVWRAFRNRRQIGGLLGFAPTPYNSGDSERDQGISGAGNARLQSLSIQLAWNWVRWQPDSALTRWYRQRFGDRKRARRIGIVAVARKLLIALWRYVTIGAVPAGAVLKAAVGG
jgi:transposase